MNSNAKKVLKEMVRECLMEILVGGLGESINESRKPSKQQTSVKKSSVAKSMSSAKSASNRLHETVAMVTDDELMRSILMDTAQTTLQEQLRNEVPGHGFEPVNETYVQADKGVDLNDLFKEASMSWATISNRLNK
jgi:hypothetical protein